MLFDVPAHVHDFAAVETASKTVLAYQCSGCSKVISQGDYRVIRSREIVGWACQQCARIGKKPRWKASRQKWCGSRCKGSAYRQRRRARLKAA